MSGDMPALEEIEVTPEMIEAGRDAVWRNVRLSERDSSTEIVLAVYRAMETARLASKSVNRGFARAPVGTKALVMARVQVSDKAFRDAVEAAVFELVQREHFDGRSIIKMPHQFGTGTSVVIEVYPFHGGATITDAGAAYREMMLAGAGDLFDRCARSIAREYGVIFEDHAIAINRVDWAQIGQAAALIAEASLTAARECIERQESRVRN